MAKIKPDGEKLAALKKVNACIKEVEKFDELNTIKDAAGKSSMEPAIQLGFRLTLPGTVAFGDAKVGGADYKLQITAEEMKMIAGLLLEPRIKAAQQTAKKNDILLDREEEELLTRYSK